LAEKFHPKDPSEELAELNRRIKEIQLDVVDIEMNLMTMENDGKEGSEYFKKAQNARERRKQLIARLEKQVLGVKRKLEKQPKG
jgi:chromosome segregation ATPase